MHLSLGRVAGLGAGVLALVGLVVPAAPGAPAPDVAAPTYSFFSANSSGDGIRVFFDVIGFLPISPALSLGTVTAEGFVESTRRTATALLPDPGGVIVAAPGLAAGLVGVPNVPGYPLVARADDPFTPTSEASPVLGTGTAVIRAEASATRAAAVARVAGAGAGGGLAGLAPVNDLITSLVSGARLPLAGSLLDLAGAEVSVEETQPSPTQLIATARTRLSGLSLLGGLVRIASIDTTATARLDGRTASASPPTVTLAGVTVAGLPAQLGEDGPSLAGSSSPLGRLLAPITDPLLAQGVALKVAPSTARVDGTTARAEGGGVVLELTSAFQGYPVVLRITFGSARAAVQATVRSAVAAAPAPASTTASTPPLLGGPVASFPTVAPTAPVVAPATGGPPGGVAPAATPVVELLDLRRVYPWLALLAVLLGGSRGLASSLVRRRPGSSQAVQDLFRW
jgi:hypothetical protein